MKIFLAKRPYDFKEGATIKDVVGEREFPRISGIWVNNVKVPKEEYTTFVLHEGDNIKVQRITGGG